jgi:hypothetical protein
VSVIACPTVIVMLNLDRAARLERIGGGVVVRAGWATMVANNATSVAAKFSVSALWPCQ